MNESLDDIHDWEVVPYAHDPSEFQKPIRSKTGHVYWERKWECRRCGQVLYRSRKPSARGPKNVLISCHEEMVKLVLSE